MADEMVIFVRASDLLLWLLPKAERLPRSFRHTAVQRLMDAALDAHDALHEAQSEPGPARLRHLRRADAALHRLRVYLRLAHQWQWLTSGQYRHGSAMVAEIGRLLGGWIKATDGRTTTTPPNVSPIE